MMANSRPPFPFLPLRRPGIARGCVSPARRRRGSRGCRRHASPV